ncbi:hypothetical protein PM8797T_18951 [Gimesia maris DSM 8797]|uniref:Oligopeptide transport permease C-like N-terminal domain-containing protein n=2 Tax=Gimesia maris TaxID=122 RepID=A0ABX5YT99_9PLAN|nr:hypothetical protein PM8797T_18951 [Gimesia maris DSM 8797]QEG19004.1 hypothetical protein GmarT_49000 [Gimesia maris]
MRVEITDYVTEIRGKKMSEQSDSQSNASEEQTSDFLSQSESKAPGILAEFWDFLKHNKKWWLAPIIIALLLIGLLILISGSAIAPFIYPI